MIIDMHHTSECLNLQAAMEHLESIIEDPKGMMKGNGINGGESSG
jgi:hypothetical protein